MRNIPSINMDATARNINRLRINAELSVKDIQGIFGFATPQAVYKWIRGTSLPAIDNLVVLAEVLGVKIDDIIVVEQPASSGKRG